MLHSTLAYSDRPIQRQLCPGAIPYKFQHNLVKEHFSKQQEEIHRKKEVCFSYSSETIN